MQSSPPSSYSYSRYIELRRESAIVYSSLSLWEAIKARPYALLSGLGAFALLQEYAVFAFEYHLYAPHARPGFTPPWGLSHSLFTLIIFGVLITWGVVILVLLYAGFLATGRSERAAIIIERFAFTTIGAILGTLFGLHIVA
jgi:hypothetical protein